MNTKLRRSNLAEKYSLSVVIPTVGKSPHLRGLLERLQRQVTTFKFEVLVVANIPQQALRKLVNSTGAQGHGTFEYLETGRLGVNLARNKGLERARAPLVLFLDDDAILDDDAFLESHVAAHAGRNDAVAIGGPYRLTAQASIWDATYHEIAHEWLHRHTMSGDRTTQLLGGNLSVKKAELQKNRWAFDEEITFGGAETGLCLRIANAGRSMYYLSSLSIGHAPDMTAALLRRKAYLQGAGAKWRSREIPPATLHYTNEFAEVAKLESHEVSNARRLYRQCFEFGWARDPFRSKRQDTRTNFNFVTFYIFLILRQRPFRTLRKFHRRIYSGVRSAWINGAKRRPLSTRPETAR